MYRTKETTWTMMIPMRIWRFELVLRRCITVQTMSVMGRAGGGGSEDKGRGGRHFQ